MDNRISLAPFGEQTKRLRNFSRCLEWSKARIVLVVEVAAIEGVGLSSNNGTVAVTLGPPTPGAVSIGPVDRAAIVAVDDVDQLAIASGESRGVGEGEGRCQAQQQGRL